jgi:hypothetical protein
MIFSFQTNTDVNNLSIYIFYCNGMVSFVKHELIKTDFLDNCNTADSTNESSCWKPTK